MKRIAVLVLVLALLTAPSVYAADDEPLEVVPTQQALMIDGKSVTGVEIYTVNGENYFRLRDMAMLLMSTDARFAVDYDTASNFIFLTTGGAYVPRGDELTVGPDKSGSCVPSSQSVTVDGKAVVLKAYNMCYSNYFRLRDLGAALGFGVDYDAAANAMLVNTKATRTVRLGTSDCFITMPLSYAPRESGGYASGVAAVSVYELTGSADVKALAQEQAGGTAVTETVVNGVRTAQYGSGDTLVLFADAGDGRAEKLVFRRSGGDADPTQRIIDSLTKMVVIRLGDSPLIIAAPPAFTAGAVTDVENGQTAAYESAAQKRYFDIYLCQYDGGFDTFVTQRAAAYGDKAGGVVNYTPMVKYFTVSGECMPVLIDLGGGNAAELRFRSADGNMDWAFEIVRSLRAG